MGYLILIAICIYAAFQIVSVVNYRNSEYCKETGNSYFSVMCDKGRTGEYRSYQAVSSYAGAKFLFNLYVPSYNGRTTEIDMVMIHSTGIYVFESKNYGGKIYGNGHSERWTQYIGKEIHTLYNPIWQNNNHVKWLSRQLQGTVRSEIFRSVVIFSGNATLKVSSVPEDVLITDTSMVQRTLPGMMTARRLSDEEVTHIYAMLKRYSNANMNTREEHIRQCRG